VPENAMEIRFFTFPNAMEFLLTFINFNKLDMLSCPAKSRAWAAMKNSQFLSRSLLLRQALLILTALFRFASDSRAVD